ncbi:phytanoyl-CoA dioxygenase family protein [Acidovorax sp. A79]|uniref:phytanoyl-CoA dioxygenase family protein n=1 Tax=Acidovorax sp. A79 TaxID=3056107 RepID=UPI0034E87B03
MTSPRILVDSGNYFSNNDNVGDRAIYQVIYHRLRHLWPDCGIHWITRSAALLQRDCPGVIALELTEERDSRSLLVSGADHLDSATPLPSDAARIVSALRNCDMVIATGGGYFSDDFSGQAEAILHTLEAGIRLGKPAAILSCGFEPIGVRSLSDLMLGVVPLLSLVVCREPQQSPMVARSFGVQEQRLVVAGDEAIELAFDARPRALGESLGINVRQADYAGVDSSTLVRLREGLGLAISRLDAPIVGVPISLFGPSDPDAIASLLRGMADYVPSLATTPHDVIREVGACRVVVTGSYHAAVFALSQGVSVVALAASPHYRSKMQGLQAQFGAACRIVFLDREDTAIRLATAIQDAWDEAESERPQLLQAARRQVIAGRAVYEQLGKLMDDSSGRPRNGTIPQLATFPMQPPMHKEITRLSLSPEEIEQFRTQGYVGPFTAFTPQEMEKFRATVRERVLPTPTPYCPFGLRVRHLDSRTVHEMCSAPAIVERMASIYGPDLVLWNSNLFNKPPARPEQPEEYPWHQDHYNWNMEPILNISAWLAITSATLENGCVEIIPGSHRQIIPPAVDTDPAMSLRFGGIASDPAYVDETRKVALVLEPGQFFLFNERLLHHSNPNRTMEHRLGLAVRVTVPIAKVSEPFPCVMLRGEDRMGFNRYIEAPLDEPDAHWVASLPPGHDYLFDRPIPGRGWHLREIEGQSHFAWTGLESQAWIDFRPLDAGEHLLRLEVIHLLTHAAVSELKLLVNGQPMAVTHQQAGEVLILEAQVPEAALRIRSDRVRVVLQGSSLVRPCDLDPASTDKRSLGLGIRRITFVPTDTALAATTEKEPMQPPTPKAEAWYRRLFE